MYIRYYLYILNKENCMLNNFYHLLNNSINYMMCIMLNFDRLHIMNHNYSICYL